MTKHKYIRYENYGFVLWPDSELLIHSNIANVCARLGRTHPPLSAGYADIDGTVVCHGRSESMGLDSRPDDSEALAKQLGLEL
jgi:hypothetical protein